MRQAVLEDLERYLVKGRLKKLIGNIPSLPQLEDSERQARRVCRLPRQCPERPGTELQLRHRRIWLLSVRSYDKRQTQTR